MKKIYFIFIIFVLFNGCATLESSLQEKNYQDAKEIVQNMDKEDINKHLDNGSTHLIETIKYNNSEITKILIKKGANIYEDDIKGYSPLYYAIKKNNPQILALILNKIVLDKNIIYCKKQLQKYPQLKNIFVINLSHTIDFLIKSSNKNSNKKELNNINILINKVFNKSEQEKIFKNVKNKKDLIKNINNKNNKFLTAILNYLIKTKNYFLLNKISNKGFIYDINYSLPTVKNTIKYVNKVETKWEYDLGYVTNLVYASNPDDSLFKNFSNALNIGVKKYISPNKILIGEYRIPTIYRELFINDYRKSNKYFIFGLHVKPYKNSWGTTKYEIYLDEPIIVNNASWDGIIKFENNNGKWIEIPKKDYYKLAEKMHLSPDTYTIKKNGIIYKELYMKEGLRRKIYRNAKFYYPKFYSLSQNVDLREDNKQLVPYGTKIDVAKPIFIPHFKTNIKKGEFESTKEYEKRLEKINKKNEKLLNQFIIKLNKRIKNYKNAAKLFTKKNIKATVNIIKNDILGTVAFHSLKNYTYDPDKEMFTINIKMLIPVNITRTFNVNYPSVDKQIVLQKIKCLGGYGNSLKLTFKINHYYNIYLAKFSKWLSTAKDKKIKKDENYITFVYPYVWDTTFNLSDIFSSTPNGAIENIKNPCLKSKIFTLHIPVKRKFAPAVDKLLSKKDFKPTLIFEVKNNRLKLTGIKELQYPDEIYQQEELMKVYNSISGIKKWLKKYPNIKLTKIAKQRLEELEYKKALRENTFKSLNKFKKMYPHSKYLREINNAIYELKQNKAMQYIAHNWFYGVQWDDIEWDGKWDKKGWPTGKGTFHLYKILSRGVFLGLGRVSAIVDVKAYIKNHKLIKGRISAYLKQTHFLSSSYTHTYSQNFEGVEDMNEKIVELVNLAIKEWNGNIIKTKNSSCAQIFNTCMQYCKLKSNKGFFNDRESCIGSCYSGKRACEEGKYRWGLRLSCAGICKGAKEGNGGLLWDSDYDKCINRCMYKLNKTN